MYNLRYHIASLAGVFLALALGLVLGGLVVQRGTIDKQQAGLVESLEKEFTALREENATLTEDNERLDSFSQMLTNEWTADRLVGTNVVVLTLDAGNDGTKAAVDALVSAGGTPVVVTIEDSDLAFQSEEVGDVIGSQAAASGEVTASIAASLAAEWQAPVTKRPLTDALEKAGALSIDGLEPGMATSALIDVAASGRTASPTGVAIAQAYASDETVVVGAQTKKSVKGAGTELAALGLSGIDTLGTSIGSYSLVALLSGAEPGLYGRADNAVAGFPDPPVD